MGSGTLGMRNNNPLNIRYNSGNHWQGLTGENKGFCTFKSRVYGYRAAFVNLQTYHVAGKDTIREIINKWAPATENNTAAYISTVCKASGFSADVKNNFNFTNYKKIVSAMSVVESAYKPTEAELQAAWDLVTVK
jgi:hypothetical protein